MSKKNVSPISKWFVTTRERAYALFDIMYNNTTNNTGYKKEDLSNAFVHAYVSATLSKKIGSTLTLQLGYLKELNTKNEEILNFGGLLPAFLDTNRDLWNNQMGIEYARKGFKNEIRLAEAIFDNIMSENSDFIVDYLNDTRRWNKEATADTLWDIIKKSSNFILLEAIPQTTKDNFDQANVAGTPGADPILVDLNGDGIKTTTIQDGIYFDHGKDGFKESSAWVDENDGILVIDRNGNGVIDNGSEVFGDNYVKSDNSKATSGFDALRDLDSNNDGIISADDESFGLIKILKGNGELISLEEAGIVSIDLNNTSVGSVDENGNTLVSSSTFTKADGSVGSLGDFNLVVDKMDSFAVNWVNESEEVSKLPDILGCGTLYSLHQAMMRDGSSVGLKKLVNDYVNAESDSVKRELVEKIIYRWCNCDSVSDGSRGTHYDAKKLNIIERFMGERFRGVNNNGIPNIWAAPFLDNVYNMITNYVYCKLEVQINDSFVRNIYDMFELEYDFDDNKVRYNFDKVIGYVDSVLSEDKVRSRSCLNNIYDFNYYLNRNNKWDLRVA